MKTVYLYDVIDDYSLQNFMYEINGDDEIELHINSVGGSVFAGLAIYNVIKNKNVVVYVDGLAASIASIIAMAGKKIIMNKGSMMMIHNPMSGLFGDAQELQKEANVLSKVKESLIDIYELKSGADREAIASWLDAETWMTADEAVSMGFADEVAEGMKLVASIDLDKYGFKNTKLYKENMMNVESTETVEAPEVTPEVAEVAPEAQETETTEVEEVEEPKAEGKVFTDAEIEEIKKQAVLDDIKRQNQIKELSVSGQEDLVNKLIVAHANVESAALSLMQDFKARILPTMQAKKDDKANAFLAFESGAPKAASPSTEVQTALDKFNKATGAEATRIYNEHREEILRERKAKHRN